MRRDRVLLQLDAKLVSDVLDNGGVNFFGLLAGRQITAHCADANEWFEIANHDKLRDESDERRE
jgi:hypothetical protein